MLQMRWIYIDGEEPAEGLPAGGEGDGVPLPTGGPGSYSARCLDGMYNLKL
jgi:hypothetical protein